MSGKYDLIVIGAGPGGYVSAIRASQLGMKTAIIEKDKPGGVCLNIGCIPSKSLIHQAEVYRSIPELEAMGIDVNKQGFDYKKVFEKSRRSAELLSKGVNYLLKKNNITYYQGTAIIQSPNDITIDNTQQLIGTNILIATGSRPKEIANFPYDEQDILSSTGALMLDKLPKSIAILGAGAIGVEFAYIMNAFGVEVYLIEVLDHILPLEDHETVDVLHKSLQKRGIKILTSSKALSMKKNNNLILLDIDQKGSSKEIIIEKIIVAVGRTPNTDNIGLESIGIELEKGFIPVEDFYQTKIPSIYAVGDVINTPLLAHVASKEGEIAIEHMAGLPVDPRIIEQNIPSAIYCEPQIASFGYPEWKLKELEIPFKKTTFPYRGAGKSVAIERSEGMLKVLSNPETKDIISAHIVGHQATEIIHELLLAKSSNLLPVDISQMIHAHPTLSEIILEIMKGIEGHPIHI